MRVLKQSVSMLAVGVGWLFVSGCSVEKESSTATACSEPPELTQRRVEAFSKNLVPVFSRSDCTRCHNGSGAPYPFANENLPVAHLAARSFTSFVNPGRSRFVTKIREERHECGSRCQEIAADLATQIAAWANAESDLPEFECDGAKSRITTATVTVRIGDLDANDPTTLTFDLAQANPAVPGVRFEVKALLFTPPTDISAGSYLLFEPRLTTSASSGAYRVRNIQVLVNGEQDRAAGNFATVDLTVAAGASTLLSDDSQMVVVEKPEGDALAFKFRLTAEVDGETD